MIKTTAPDRAISVAVLAMGGQGGGVLTDWIVATAEHAGWVAQSTSVPGVAQRTGATIYYIEMLPRRDGREPILSLMPTPGDVDVVLAAEFMEAGRSVMRGFVTPDRTTLIASTHRNLAVVEKVQPGDGIASSRPVIDASGIAARRTVQFDMQALAEQNGSVISATMFGALAGAGVLPFGDDAFEAAIMAGGRGVEPSLRAFHAAADRARNIVAEPAAAPAAAGTIPLATGHPALNDLLERLRTEVPEPVRLTAFAGVKRLTDYQDHAYAGQYLDTLGELLALDGRFGDGSHAFSQAGSKYLAVAMSYDDVIRVADLKTRAARFARIDREIGKRPDQLLYMTEFMHPRMAEVAGALPARVGAWLEARPALFARLDKVVSRGRRVQTGTVLWFLSLYLVSAMKPMRRRSLRHQREMAHVAGWVSLAKRIVEADYGLAVEVLACHRLVKGYADTHARGISKFDRVLAEAPGLVGKPDAAAWLRRLRETALADEDGTILTGAIRTLHSTFAPILAKAAS